MSVQEFTTKLGDVIQIDGDTGAISIVCDREEARGRVFLDVCIYGVYFKVPDGGDGDWHMIDLYPAQDPPVPSVRIHDPDWEEPMVVCHLGERLTIDLFWRWLEDKGLDEYRDYRRFENIQENEE